MLHTFGRFKLDDDQAALAEALIESVIFGEMPRKIERLTPRTSKIVFALAGANGRPLTFDTLCFLSQDPADPISRKSLQIYLWNIKKMRPDVYAHIRNVRGYGYRWDGPREVT